MLCPSLVNLRIFSAIFGCNGNPHNPHTLSFHTSLSLSHSLHGPFQEFSSATDWRQASGPVAQSPRNSVHLVVTWTYLINLRPSKTYVRSIWCLAVINPSSTPCQIWTWPDSAHLAIPRGKKRNSTRWDPQNIGWYCGTAFHQPEEQQIADLTVLSILIYFILYICILYYIYFLCYIYFFFILYHIILYITLFVIYVCIPMLERGNDILKSHKYSYTWTWIGHHDVMPLFEPVRYMAQGPRVDGIIACLRHLVSEASCDVGGRRVSCLCTEAQPCREIMSWINCVSICSLE
jgi:hypothetical protein